MTGPTPGQGSGDTPSGSERVQISDNTESRSYDAVLDGQIADTIVYERTGGARIVFTDKVVERAFRAGGIGMGWCGELFRT